MIRLLCFLVTLLLLICTPAHSFELADSQRINERITDFDIVSGNLVSGTTVRVMLPTGYTESEKAYPVIYLLHGGGGTHEDWTIWGVQEIVGDLDVIIVQPSMGKGSWYADATVPGIFGTPKWETFFFEELIPWVDNTFKTDARREARAVVGLSMGGYGAMSYAARHPDHFVAAASFSGAVDTSGELVSNWIGVSPIIEGRMPYSIFGLWPLDALKRQKHNPLKLASNLRGMHLSFYFGNGKIGPLDSQVGYNPIALFMGWIQEAEVQRMNFSMHDRLNELGVVHNFYPYGDGQHSAGYWIRSFKDELPDLMRVFNDPPVPANWVVNGGFEYEGAYAVTNDLHWECNGVCGLDHYVELSHLGNGNGWIRSNDDKWHEIYQDVSVASNTDYYLTGWLRASGSKLALFGVRGRDGVSLADKSVIRGDEYVNYQISFNSGDNDQVRVYAGLKPGGNDSWIQIDEVFMAAGYVTEKHEDVDSVNNQDESDEGGNSQEVVMSSEGLENASNKQGGALFLSWFYLFILLAIFGRNNAYGSAFGCGD